MLIILPDKKAMVVNTERITIDFNLWRAEQITYPCKYSCNLELQCKNIKGLETYYSIPIFEYKYPAAGGEPKTPQISIREMLTGIVSKDTNLMTDCLEKIKGYNEINLTCYEHYYGIYKYTDKMIVCSKQPKLEGFHNLIVEAFKKMEFE